jgi:ketosteroid isomerase-like protein
MNVDPLREAIEAQDKQRYAALLAEDVRFFSPIEAEPSVGREAASMFLSTVFEEGALRRGWVQH